MKYPTALLTFVLLPLAGATAQIGRGIAGLTRASQSLVQTRHSPCVLVAGCVAPGMPALTAFTAGGTAFDGTSDVVWATNGQALASYAGPSGCVLDCGPVPCPKSAPAANASGLDVVESLAELWVVDDANWLTRCTLGCPPVVATQCAVAVGAGEHLTGVAVDDGRGLVFYTAISPVGSTLHVAEIATPCAPFFSGPLVDCSAMAVSAQGVAVDWGNRTMYWTDGPSTYSSTYSYNPAGPSFTVGPLSCCPAVVPANDPYTDLTLKPRGSAPAGMPCANGTCPACPDLHVLRNAPILGNTLELGLDEAPEGALAWCLVRFGPCSAGAPVIAPLCGPLYVGSVGTTIGFQVTSSGSGSCLGSATFDLPLPAVPAFAGLQLASQCIVVCGPLTGTAMSNCQSWVLAGS